jgi:Kef-type K+ transport system membrane component KefB
MTSAALAQVFLSLAVVVGLARIGAALFERFGQPGVVGEIVAGIAVGPSLLGAVAPGVMDTLIPASVLPSLQVVSQLGLIVFMLVVGAEVETILAGRNARLIAAVAVSASAVPFGLGVLLALGIWPLYRTPPGLPAFLLFIGTALAVTAFPVLARIVRDRGLAGTTMGTVALACAAFIDLAAWSVLSVVVSIAGKGGHGWTPLPLALAFILLMLLVVRPLLAWAQRSGRLDRVSPQAVLVLVLVGAALSAWYTETIGLHSIFGPFVLGLALPRHRPTMELITTRLADTSSALLLPAFFVIAGMAVDVPGLDPVDLLVLLGTVAVAVAGKVLATALPARLCGMGPRDAWTLGVLLNTRGLTELVVLSVGLSLGVLHPHLYTILVVTAVLTTVATGPLLAALGNRAAQPARPPLREDTHEDAR